MARICERFDPRQKTLNASQIELTVTSATKSATSVQTRKLRGKSLLINVGGLTSAFTTPGCARALVSTLAINR
jgi:hypothetical protein